MEEIGLGINIPRYAKTDFFRSISHIKSQMRKTM